MLTEIKKCADAQDIKGLRYIFADCLDVDPTFEKYRESYEFCKKIPGLFESHQELSDIVENQSKWSREYWDQLKMDLMKNFSQRRFEHMIQVAKVVYGDKIDRLLKERSESESQAADTKKQEAVRSHESDIIDHNAVPADSQVIKENNSETKLSEAELQEKRLEEKRKEIEENNKRVEREQAAQRARIEEKRRSAYNGMGGDFTPKKSKGIVIGIIAVVIVVLLIMILR